MSVIPAGMTSPVNDTVVSLPPTVDAVRLPGRKGRSKPISTAISCLVVLSLGASNGIAGGLAIGKELAPLFRGRMEPFATNATALIEAK
jgi:hypothetical protein